ncbi:hypothetical protein BGZ80_002804 [Entomortierella chlamydospora]|uniref:Uncharacterized protein n=1 Tax=Entomortierella chlamydospora TaxID=101097 RepID=A0A9P6MPU1_9FUNG|nr:hypothetical protein BGZ80_002804 [Entomortierella chlamydospora]
MRPLGKTNVARDQGELDCLSKVLSTQIPNLHKIHFGKGREYSEGLTDRDIATLLSSCRYGLKVVEITHNLEFHGASVAALAQHYPTLEALAIGDTKFESNELLLLLTSTPKLQTLISIDDGYYEQWPQTSIESRAFIDLEPVTNSPTPWACESTLKELRIRITGIPRPDLGRQQGVVEEVYAGQGREIQIQVYERLARFTNLESLWLGSNPSIQQFDSSPEREQRDCIEMSLENGLDKLGGLKELRVLSLAHMNTRIGLKEVQWMVENWPKLHVIRGLGDEGNESDDEDEEDEDETEYEKILDWLEEHCPEILVLDSDTDMVDNYLY